MSNHVDCTSLSKSLKDRFACSSTKLNIEIAKCGNSQSVRDENGTVSSRCFWDACRACFLALVFIISGCVIALFGFYGEYSSIESPVAANASTRGLYQTDPLVYQSRYKLPYTGPILIGLGGFILIAVGVVTLEMRDMSSKVCPLSTKRPLAANVPAKAKFTPELLIEMFQTPSMRIVQELARKASRVRTISCQTRHYYRNVNTSNRNVIFRSWDCIYVRHKDRRCCVYKRRHKQVQSKHLVNCKAKFSLAFSCPALATIS